MEAVYSDVVEFSSSTLVLSVPSAAGVSLLLYQLLLIPFFVHLPRPIAELFLPLQLQFELSQLGFLRFDSAVKPYVGDKRLEPAAWCKHPYLVTDLRPDRPLGSPGL